MPDYIKYKPEKKELATILLIGSMICLITGWLFFNSLFGVFLTSLYLPVYIKMEKAEKHKAQLYKLRYEFKDALNSLTAALEAGYSVENAITETISELELIYDDKAAIIIEFKEIARKMKNNINIETALWDFALRSKIDDIMYFTEVFITAKRSGGNLLNIIRATRNNICDKIEMNRELTSMISAKLYEIKIMKMVPLGILAYLKIYNYEMISPLYEKITGNIIMFILLAGYFGLCRLADKITDMRL